MPWYPKHNDIYQFPFQEFSEPLEPLELVAKLEYYRPKIYHQWIMPQLFAHFGRFRVTEPRWQTVAKENLHTKWDIGVWRLVTQCNRGDLLTQQNKNSKYGSLTPLILAGIREHQKIDYSQWDLADQNFALMENRLLQAIQYPAPEVSVETLLELRQDVLTYKSGKRSGEAKNPESTWSLGAMRGTPLEGSPPLQRVMLLQLWLAHPTVRHPLMILDPKNLDKVPMPLATTTVTLPQTTPQLLPWL